MMIKQNPLTGSYYDVQYQSNFTIYENQTICRIETGEFNVSTNPTAVYRNNFDYDIDGMFYIYYQIENDLIRFFNDDIATMDFITEKNIKKMERILSIKKKLEKNKKKTIDCLMNSTDSLQVNSRINILIGALTCEERSKFLKLFA